LLGGQCRHAAHRKNIHNNRQVTVEFPSGNGNGRELGINRWEKMGMGFKFQLGMGMGWEWSLKWEGTGTKNLFPHISTSGAKSDVIFLLGDPDFL